MRKDSKIIYTALDMYYEGLSVRKTCRQIHKIFGEEIDPSTIWDWIQKYAKLVKAYVDTLQAENLSGKWHADETMILSKGEKDSWLWAVLDKDTKYLVSSHLSKLRTEKDAIALFRQAKKRSVEKPKTINVDGLYAYRKGFTKNFYSRYKGECPEFVQRVGIKGERNNNPIERLHGTLKDRTKPARGLGSNHNRQKIETIRNVMKGWDVHYNFVRPHGTLGGRTPAQVAGVGVEVEGWGDLIRLATVHQSQQKILPAN
jgi:transposase-like protein